MKYLLDTDHISILQLQSGPEYASLSLRIAQASLSDLVLSVISFHEQVLGAHSYINRARTSSEMSRGYEMLLRLLTDYQASPVLPFDRAAVQVFDLLTTQRVRIGTMDLRIASIALSRGLVLLTRNFRDFGKVPGLMTEDWTI